MKKLFILVALFLDTLQITAQQTFYVSNNPVLNAEYTTIKSACDVANPGDIILVDGTGLSYGVDTVNKAVNVIGPGDFFGAQLDGSTYSSAPALFTTIRFIEGAEGATMSGIESIYLYVNDDNIVIKRNYITNSVFLEYVFSTVIHQNYIGNVKFDNAYNILLTNNIISSIGYPNDFVSSTAIIEHNTIYGIDNSVDDSTIKNNIIYTLHSQNCGNYNISTSNGNTIENNIIVCENNNVNTSNQTNVDVYSLFIGYPSNTDGYTTDAQYQLAPDSPAIGAADDGGDCGAFGGLEPYVLSATPSIPVIYDLNAPTNSNGNNLNVEVKVKTNN